MNLVKWDPFREMEDVVDRFNRILSSRSTLPGDAGKEIMTTADWAPVVDISETNDEYLIKAELPGIEKKDIKVTINEGVLTMHGERKQEKEEKGKRFHRIERSYGSFVRTFSIPDDVDETRVKAEHKDGMMYLHMPKSEKAKPKSIEVKVD